MTNLSTLSDKEAKWLTWCVEGARVFSTCGKQQYMALIVDENGIIESTGYNGSPKGFDHCKTGCPRFVNNVPSGTAYDSGEGLCYAIHAEINCLLHSDPFKRKNGTMYVSGVPCFGCAKAIANSGISKLIYKEEDFDRLDFQEVQDLFNLSKIKIVVAKEL